VLAGSKLHEANMIEELLFKLKIWLFKYSEKYRFYLAKKRLPKTGNAGLCVIDKERRYKTLQEAIKNANKDEYIFVFPK